MKAQYSYSPCYEATLDLRQRAFENVRWIFTETNFSLSLAPPQPSNCNHRTVQVSVHTYKPAVFCFTSTVRRKMHGHQGVEISCQPVCRDSVKVCALLVSHSHQNSACSTYGGEERWIQEKPEKKIPLGRHNRTWWDNIKIDLQKVRWGGGLVVAQLVEALRYKPGCRRFDSQLGHWNFTLT